MRVFQSFWAEPWALSSELWALGRSVIYAAHRLKNEGITSQSKWTLTFIFHFKPLLQYKRRRRDRLKVFEGALIFLDELN